MVQTREERPIDPYPLLSSSSIYGQNIHAKALNHSGRFFQNTIVSPTFVSYVIIKIYIRL
jgi:hypothetical protein